MANTTRRGWSGRRPLRASWCHHSVVTLSQEQYNAMLLGAHPLLLAKQNEVNAYREFIESLRDYWTARADLERATGGSVPMPKKTTGAMSNATPSAAPAGARP